VVDHLIDPDLLPDESAKAVMLEDVDVQLAVPFREMHNFSVYTQLLRDVRPGRCCFRPGVGVGDLFLGELDF
jgi:hypothetical protein